MVSSISSRWSSSKLLPSYFLIPFVICVLFVVCSREPAEGEAAAAAEGETAAADESAEPPKRVCCFKVSCHLTFFLLCVVVHGYCVEWCCIVLDHTFTPLQLPSLSDILIWNRSMTVLLFSLSFPGLECGTSP